MRAGRRNTDSHIYAIHRSDQIIPGCPGSGLHRAPFPWQRAYIERVIGSIRRECIDFRCWPAHREFMRTLKLRSRPPAVLLVLLVLLVSTQACGYRRTMVFPSPTKRVAVEIWQTRIESSMGMRIELVSGHRRFVVYRGPNEARPHFV